MGNSNTTSEKPKSQADKSVKSGREVSATPVLTDDVIKETLGENEARWYLSAEQKSILRDSWQSLQSNIESVGTVTFLKMFETHPETLKPFIPEVERLQEMELNEWYRENLKVHAIRVMAVIEKTMHRLDDEKRAAKILSSYGRRHCSYGVTPTMLDKMAASFLVAIQPSLEDKWNKRVEESWLALFKRITFFMSLGYPDSCRRVANDNSVNDDNFISKHKHHHSHEPYHISQHIHGKAEKRKIAAP